MITLYGFAISNYYNKIKLALMEKEIAFLEESIPPSQDDSMLKRSPLGKIPFIETADGYLSESQAILEYLEDAFPENPLYPATPFERAKCREFIQHLELNIELIARRLYKEALMGGTVSQETKDEVKDRVTAGLKGLTRLTKFSPYVLGANISAADVVAWPHFCLISLATQKIYGIDLVAEYLPGVTAYLQIMENRPTVQQVAKDRDAAFKAFLGSR
jgi:glutathione S-transferase